MKKISIFLVVAVLLAMCALGFAACGDKIADNTEHLTAVTKTLKLTKSYEGKKLFSDDGIGEANLLGESATTDGDTTYFSLKSGGSVNVRYAGIDTPESTAGVEKWGKAASLFTNERLHEATAIVIESESGKAPEKDSKGTRYMCYVWYKTADHDFYLLNLELVENGFSRNNESALSSYYSYFQKAENAARKIQLRLFSKLDDPLFSDKIMDMTVKELNELPADFGENNKVRVMAYISDVSISSTGSQTYTIAQLDQTTGKVYTFKLFAGYSGYATSLRVGDLYQIVGTLQKHDGAWQISGVEGNNDKKGDETTSWRQQYSYCITLDPSNALYTSKRTPNAYAELTVTSDPVLEGTTLTFGGSAIDCNGDALPEGSTFSVTVPENYKDGQIAKGATLVIRRAYQLVALSNQYTILNFSDITIK